MFSVTSGVEARQRFAIAAGGFLFRKFAGDAA
jgi:hypothetical protein